MIYKIENISAPQYTDTLYEKAYSAMSPARREKTDRYKHIEDKKLCVFSDMILRKMLSEHFGIDKPEFYLSSNGKPCLVGDKFHFSISHSGTFIACAVDTAPVGIDIEVPRSVYKRVINHCCTEKEAEHICSDLSAISDPLPANSAETQRFLALWTAKEAYLKHTGEGLGGGLKNIIVAEKGKVKNSVNGKSLLTITEKEYVLSVISENEQTHTPTQKGCFI